MAGESDLKISGINFQPVILGNYTAAQAPETSPATPVKALEKNNNGQETSKDVVSISPEASVLNKNQAQQSATTAEATGARENPQKVISDKLSELKTVLEGITKNYPPFPSESKERAAILESYSALRKEIERLTFPPPLDSQNNRKGWMWDDLFKKEVLTKLPEALTSTASDKDVHNAVDTITDLQKMVSTQKD